ncbi:MAG: FAD-binding protein [Polyangiales bacterium]
MSRWLWFVLISTMLASCSAAEQPTSAPAPEPAADTHDEPAPGAPTLRMDAGVARADPAPAPRDPSALPVTSSPGAGFDADLAKLLAHRRDPATLLSCPGLLIAGTCGNGACDGLTETPESCPADCAFHLVGAYNDLPVCTEFMEVVEPNDVAGVQAAVRAAVAAGKRVRAIGASHSASQVICGDGVALRTSKLADVGKTVVRDGIAYVQPGVHMIDLGDWLHARGQSIGFTHLGFRRVTVAGAIGTSAHGSSPRENSALSHRVESLTLVLADGSLRTFERRSTADDLWRALQTNLGLLGVVIEVGIALEPAFQLDTKVDVLDEKLLLDASSPLDLLAGCDWGQMNWFPHQRKLLRWCGKRTAQPPQNADNTLLDPGVPGDIAGIAKTGFHAGTCDADLNALLESARFGGLVDAPPIRVTDARGAVTHTDHAIGPAHRMTSAELIALGDQKYFQMDWEVAVPEQHMQTAVRAARALFDAHDVSLPGVGAFLRFGKIERGGWLSYHSAGEQFEEGKTAMFFETPVAVPAGYTDAALRSYLHIYEQLASLFIRHLGARAHWGKNLDALFDLQRAVGSYGPRIEGMNRAVAELDPYGVFANTFASRIGIRWPRGQEDFASALGGTRSCACDAAAEPVCAVGTRTTYANACRAACDSLSSANLVKGPCASLELASCSLLDARTCVWRKRGKHADRSEAPLIRF